ncbi:DUF177 domain-containing protein [Desulfosarcina sp. OttesenSCG-928-A07]|nr:DUF177 domain-containing protein [Desulfosarcina sp. OttesenSCG-928-G17]MDL2329602.1 DUF177 domain-containing protein [Desulfosarcina sp. OttesenSCG-928-A07]
MLKIRIDSIGSDGFDKTLTVPADLLPLLDALVQREEIHFTRSIDAHIQARMAGDHIVVTGVLKTGVNVVCGRCLETFETYVETEFSATARSEAAMPMSRSGDDTDDIELSAGEMDFIPCTGNILDLETEIAQQIIMALPFSPLCSDACKGLCAHCGANHNRSSCNCRESSENTAFSILKTLQFPTGKK